MPSLYSSIALVLIFLYPPNAALAEYRFPNIYSICRKEISTICKHIPPTEQKKIRQCLNQEILFISMACEQELEIFETHFSEMIENFLKSCKNDVLRYCTANDIKNTSSPKAFENCASKIKSEKLGQSCRDHFQKIYR